MLYYLSDHYKNARDKFYFVFIFFESFLTFYPPVSNVGRTLFSAKLMNYSTSFEDANMLFLSIICDMLLRTVVDPSSETCASCLLLRMFSKILDESYYCAYCACKFRLLMEYILICMAFNLSYNVIFELLLWFAVPCQLYWSMAATTRHMPCV